MKKKSYPAELIVPLTTLISDAVAIGFSFLFSYWLRFQPSFLNFFPPDSGIPEFKGYLVLSSIVLPVWLMVFQSRRMYRPRRVVFIFDEFFLIVKLVSISLVITLGLIFFYRVFPYSRLVFIIIWISSIIFITAGRYFALRFEKSLYKKRKALKNALIFGCNETALDIYTKLSGHPYNGFNIAGYIREEPLGTTDLLNSKSLLGNYSQIAEVIKNHDIDTVLVAISSNEHNKLFDALKLCEGDNVEFFLVPDFLEMITSSVRVQEIDGVPFLRIKSIPMNIWNRMAKRLFDILFSSIVLILTSPLFLLLALLVKTTSKGPVFYKQERLSMTGKKFQMIKFRSMVIDAEDETGAVFASKGDSRYTPIGELLRKYSLDELAQFINVFLGDMSIVGPRPEREYFINLMKNQIPKYLERHRIKCGITGWAQVNGLRGTDTSLEKRIEYDIYYIEHWSIVFDLKIILKTIKEMFFSKTAF